MIKKPCGVNPFVRGNWSRPLSEVDAKSEREMIEEALSCGKVTKCKPGLAWGVGPYADYFLGAK